MDDLRKRFGRLVSAHRKRARFSQAQLAELAGVSKDMISKIEIGASGARFPVIERISSALDIDPAELFTTELSPERNKSRELAHLNALLAGLSDNELKWVTDLIEAALQPRK